MSGDGAAQTYTYRYARGAASEATTVLCPTCRVRRPMAPQGSDTTTPYCSQAHKTRWYYQKHHRLQRAITDAYVAWEAAHPGEAITKEAWNAVIQAGEDALLGEAEPSGTAPPS